MKLLIVSDTHKRFEPLLRLAMTYKGKIDLIIHLGDGADDVDDLFSSGLDIPIRSIRGNCDWACLKPFSDLVSLGGAKIFICHGHDLGVRYSRDRLAMEAKRLGASTALYGHTHCQRSEVINGVQCINPGSLCEPRDGKSGYAILEIVNGVVNCTLHQLKD